MFCEINERQASGKKEIPNWFSKAIFQNSDHCKKNQIFNKS